MKTRLLALSLFALSFSLGSASDSFFFQDGDKAVLLGDSITEGATYSTLVESYVLSRFPQWNITFRNAGWSGDTMGLRRRGGVEKGFLRDLQPLAPTAVTINFGMNDARAGEAGLMNYLKNARDLADKFNGEGTRMAFVSPSPEEKYEKGRPAGSAYNLLLGTYSEGLREVAEEKNALFVDQLAPTIAVIESGRESGALASQPGGVRLIPDGVHPHSPGGMVIATALLKGLNAPALVSRVEIDATDGKAKTENATLSDVRTGDTLTFRRLDSAMPWPVDSAILSMPEIPGFTPFDDLSRYELKITGLTADRYEVTIDHVPIGIFTKEELAKGLNLAAKAIPAMPEVEALRAAIVAKNRIYFELWRKVKLAPPPEDEAGEQARTAKIEALEAKLAEAEAALAPLRQPQIHLWSIVRTP